MSKDVPYYTLEQLTKLQRQAEREKFVIDLLQQIHAVGLPDPDREVIFHKTRKWRLDIAWRSLKIAVEVDGGVYSRGRHTRGKGYEEDCIKRNEALLDGWLVLNVTTGQVKRGEAIQFITRAFSERG